MGLLSAIQDEQFWRDVAKNGRGLLQGASNAVASNITGPVDLINAGMGLLGLPVSREPVGGEAWARKKGLTAAAPGAAGLAGETLGLVGPMVVAGKAPQVAAGLLKMADNAMAPSAANQAARNQLGAIVYHGSPHKFDRFDASKIGTGEGAQAYGHGLYFAESPDVAKSYQSALSADRGFSFGGKTGLTRAEVQDMVNAKYGAGYLDGVIRPSGVADSFIDDMVTGTVRGQGGYPRQYKPGSERAKIYDELRGQITHADPGSLYKVDLPDNAIARMLDWDKPLSQQAPEVQAAFVKLGADGNMTGQQAYRAAHEAAIRSGKALPAAEKERQSVEQLRRAGIPGIRYLDAGSRGAGAGTSNYVVFPGEESLLKILERNGVAP